MKYPNEYSEKWADKWSFSQLPMIPTDWKFGISKNTKAQYDVLKELMNRQDISKYLRHMATVGGVLINVDSTLINEACSVDKF